MPFSYNLSIYLSSFRDNLSRPSAYIHRSRYIRTLPGIIDGFAAAYGTHDLVTAFDRLAGTAQFSGHFFVWAFATFFQRVVIRLCAHFSCRMMIVSVNRPVTCGSEAIAMNEPGQDGTAFVSQLQALATRARNSSYMWLHEIA